MTIKADKRIWVMAYQLAAELAQRGVDINIAKTAAAFMQAYPDADMADWLERLAKLGDLFGSSQQTGRYRLELRAACQRLQPQPRSGAEWALVLGWAARLYSYYQDNPALARQLSDVSHLPAPEPLPVYKPPRLPKRTAVPPLSAAATKPSQKSEDYMAKLQKKWGEEKK